MSRKKMYGLLAFILFTFTLLGIVVSVELNQYSKRTNEDEAVYSEETLETNDLTASNNSGQDSDTPSAETADSGSDSMQSETGDSTDSDEAASAEETKEEWSDISLLFTGDIYLSDYVLNQYNSNGISGILSPELLNEFKTADVAMSNEEFAFTNGGTAMEDKQYTFRVDPKYTSVLQDMSLDIVTLANNHTMDYGLTGLTDSFAALNSAGIQYVGAGNNLSEARDVKYFDVKGKTIAYLAASRVIPVPDWNAYNSKAGMLTTYDPTFLLEDIKTAKQNSDFVVVYTHWGLEKHDMPEDYQRNLAKQYIDAGADLVVGSHPHVLQGIEYYNGKPIIYSLGNFIFYSSIDQTAVLNVSINEQNEARIQLLPAKAENSATSLVMEANEVADFYDYLKTISFGVEFDNNGWAVNSGN